MIETTNIFTEEKHICKTRVHKDNLYVDMNLPAPRIWLRCPQLPRNLVEQLKINNRNFKFIAFDGVSVL